MLRFPTWKIITITVVFTLGFLFALPNVFTPSERAKFPDFLPSKAMNLGLDLRGGSYLLFEVDVKSAFHDQLLNLVQSMRTELVRARIPYHSLGVSGDTATVTIRDPDKTTAGGDTNLEKAHSLLRKIEPGLQVTDGSGGKLTLQYSESARRDRETQILTQSIEIVRRRVDEFGTTEPSIQRQGEDRILVQLPGVGDPERIKNVIGKTAKMTFHLVDDRYPPGSAMPSVPPPGDIYAPLQDKRVTGGKPIIYALKRRSVVTGDMLVDAQPTYDQGRPVVSFRFDSVGARKFAQITQQNVGKPFAIVLDGKIISAPRIQEPILGGSGIITGGFTTEEAKDLAVLLRAGALPASMKVLEQRSVGPDLGADSIAAGEVACVIGLILVVVFMFLSYSLFGLLADIALMVNLILLVGGMSILQATLTLPGIAGIVLTMGMAVDANVLIYERIREEARAGRTILSAIDAGFQRAFTTILDSNLTTFISAVLLYEFGAGPVRGFAVTLSIGLITSMFTAIMVTRFLIALYVSWRRPKVLPV